LLLLLVSMSFNFYIGRQLQLQARRWVLVAGIAGNLGLLAYFKYAHFLVGTINWLSGVDLAIDVIVLPLAISFFTFQQIAWLVDAYRGQASEYNPVHYALFVCFFHSSSPGRSSTTQK
jgi:D-alanyl-lipoteichoic acid acyltransferase DltB (MBOAT superfamily)